MTTPPGATAPLPLGETVTRWVETLPLIRGWTERRRLDSVHAFMRNRPEVRIAAPAGLTQLDGKSVTPHGGVFLMEDPRAFDMVVLRMSRLGEVDPRLTQGLLHEFGLVFSNRAYAVLARAAGPQRDSPALRAIQSRLAQFLDPEVRGVASHRPDRMSPVARGARTACFVTTFDRPAALARSLPQIVALGRPTLVVDDGSAADLRRANQEIATRHGARYLALPENRGLSAAMNIGLGYWMADPSVGWVSYLQDDAAVREGLFDVMEALQDRNERPLLTGYDAPEHPVVDTADLGSLRIVRKRSSAGVHLHAHVDYWASVMPIPTPYLGAPKPRLGASMEDWWIGSHAPKSTGNTGRVVVCAPGLVTTFVTHRDDSSWDNPGAL